MYYIALDIANLKLPYTVLTRFFPAQILSALDSVSPNHVFDQILSRSAE